MNTPALDRLLNLYHNTSKHSNYQLLPTPLRALISHEQLTVRTRHEKERFDYLSRHLDLRNKRVVDIGGNTGFFTIESLYHGAHEVFYYEGNKEHAEFVTDAAAVLGYESRIHVSNQYITFGDSLPFDNIDITYLLNVLHHIGDDYGDPAISRKNALQEISRSIRLLAGRTMYLVLQLGFNWKGDRALPLFNNGTKRELIDFVEAASVDHWTIEHVGIPVMNDSTIRYQEQDEVNIQRNDPLGEFLNRPLFILKSSGTLK